MTNHGYANGRATPRQSVLEAGTAVLVDRYGYTADDVFVSVMPIYLLSILLLGPVTSIRVGATCRLLPRYDPWGFAQAVREGRIDFWGDGTEVREYVHITDAAALAVNALDDRFGEAGTVGGGECATAAERFGPQPVFVSLAHHPNPKVRSHKSRGTIDPRNLHK